MSFNNVDEQVRFGDGEEQVSLRGEKVYQACP